VWRNSKPYQNPEDYFGPTEYVICDTAFDPSPFCIPAFSADVGFLQSADKQLFNFTLLKPRVSSEHTIGILKGHFPGALQKMSLLLTHEKKSMKKILMYIDAAIVLHNILIDLKDDVCSEWVCDDDVTVIDDPNSVEKIPEEQWLFECVPAGAPKGWRQDQLKDYICETEVPNFNFTFPDDVDGLEKSDSFDSISDNETEMGLV